MIRVCFPHKFAIDLLLWGVAPLLAYLARFDGRIPADQLPGLWWLLGIGLVAKAVALARFRLHHQSWRHASFRDLAEVVRAGAVVGAIEVIAGMAIRTQLPLPRSALLLSVLFGVVALVAMRAGRRAFFALQRRRAAPGGRKGRRVLVVGAGEAGNLVVREMLRHPESGLTPVAILDDDAAKRNVRLEGVPVLGPLADLPRLLREDVADEVVIAIASADGALVRRVNTLAAEGNPRAPVRVVPRVYEVLSGEVSVSRLRELRIEDLLRRPPVPVDLAPVRGYLAGRTVLVTGAGGSIGSELVRQLVQVGVTRVIALGRGENSLHELLQGLRRRGNRVEVVPAIVDVRDTDSLRTVFERHRPEVVFHAAAHKHVPFMEEYPEQAVLNNVEGTRNLVAAARTHGVRVLVNISTDKAVNPSSVLGASKRLAECLVKDLANGDGLERRYVSVRFGNVLGSRGSVIPLFQRQIEDGGPVTVTDASMTRYFMTIPESVQLVLQAGALAQPGAVYFLDMGQPVRIAQLAEDMIRLLGLRPHEDIEIHYTGRRRGEKLFEELTTGAEATQPTGHPKVFMAHAVDLQGAELTRTVDELAAAARAGEAERVVMLLRNAVVFAEDGVTVAESAAGSRPAARPTPLPEGYAVKPSPA